MENRYHSPNQETPKGLTVFLDQQILADFDQLDCTHLNLTNPLASKLTLMKKDGKLSVTFPNGESCEFPYYFKNIKNILDGIKSHRSGFSLSDAFERLRLSKKNFIQVFLSDRKKM